MADYTNFKFNTENYVILPMNERVKWLSIPKFINCGICHQCHKESSIFRIGYLYWCPDCLLNHLSKYINTI